MVYWVFRDIVPFVSEIERAHSLGGFEAARHSIGNMIAHQSGERFGSGTCFLVKDHLITCAHVTSVPAGFHVAVRFEHPREGATQEWDFGGTLPFKGYSDEHSHDFAILALPKGVVCGPSLQLADRLPLPGEPVCTMGYPFEDPHLTIHQGIVSAVFRSGPATILKLDMSVNPSNSGGPLISMLDGKVVGVVARKATGLTRAFNQLIQSFEANAKALEAASGGAFLSGIDPMQVLAVTQRQMQLVSAQLERSANVGIGYAMWVDTLRQESALEDSVEH